MSKGFLRAKARVQVEGESFTIERQCTDGVWVLRNMKTERPMEKTTSELLEAYNSGHLKLERPARAKISSPERTSSLIAKESVPALENGLKAASFRLLFIKAVLHLPTSKSAYGAAILEVARSQNIPADKIPSWVSVYRWARAYLNSGSAPNVLVASNIDKGNRAPRFAEPVLEICQQTIETKFLTLERGTIVDTLAIARAETRRANKHLPVSEQLSLPTYRLINRLVNDIPVYDRDLARYGREHARKKYRTSLHHRQTEAPLERGEIDHTRMDLFAIDDENGFPLGRPWLTILIDDYTRCVLGYCLSFEPPSRATVARCLRHAFMPKTGLREKYPDLKNDWDAYGIVSELVMDGGTEFHSKELEQICFDLDIEQHFAPRKTPWFKGKVERFQGTLNRGVTVSTPGKTFGGIVERDDYDPKKHAIVTMSALKHLLEVGELQLMRQRT